MYAVSRLAKEAVILLLLSSSAVFAQTPQEHVHQMSAGVMPFDMAKTVHVFTMTESGGVQRVVVRDAGDADQIAMIKKHLRHEAQNFQSGDFSDPATLHGETMSGLKDLETGASDIKVYYIDLSLGGEIRFETSDLHLITAIHRWFGAQLSEHGSDAESG